MTNFVGTWNATIDTPIRRMAVVFNITEEKGVFSGTSNNEEESVDMVNFCADGDVLTWTQEVSKPMKLTLKFNVTFDGDEMAGTAKAGIFPASKLRGSRATA